MLQNQLDSMICSTFIRNYTELQIFTAPSYYYSLTWGEGKPIAEYM